MNRGDLLAAIVATLGIVAITLITMVSTRRGRAKQGREWDALLEEIVRERRDSTKDYGER